LLGILDHLIDLNGRETTNGVGDANGSFAAGGAVLSSDLQETVGIDLKGGDKLGLTTGHGRNAIKFELAKETVVAALSTLALVNREGDRGLVVLDGSEDTRFIRGNGSVTRHNNTEDVTLHCNTQGQRSNIEKEEILGLFGSLTCEDGSLDGSTIGNGFIGINGLVELTTTEVLRDECLDLGDTGGATNKDDIVDLLTSHLGILQNPLDGVKSGLEHSGIDLLEPSTRDVRREVFTLVEGINFNSGLSDTRECPLGTFASRPETPESTSIIRNVVLSLPLELILEVLEESVIEIFASKMSVTSSSLHREDTAANVEERNI